MANNLLDNSDDDIDEVVNDGTIDTGDGTENSENDDTEEYVAPTKEEWAKTQSALARANAEAKKHRLKAKDLASKTDTAGDDKATKAAEDAEKRYKPIAIRSAAKAAFLEAGLNDASPDQVKKLMRMIDMEDVDVDDDGDVIGLEDQIEGIKSDFPGLFKTKDARKRAPRLDASGRSNGGTTAPKTTGEKIAAQLFAR